ncbi:methylmalonyl-CoA mutase small subunit [Streptomyces sp. 110]|uniref:Methylmalonyl-CoA mutase small subunit n=1 Tax=Streptomyces endocoffeicus TaxID=2898945 RepID=A0ABS1PHU3_9ACTN|nr:methylmalonyl-CoA mutase small subunit [Streptomyces endocoffeicus]MBL1111923.1 methylmalonyl-CoA mutase small subunit [Streptomyces endocoffeicus]
MTVLPDGLPLADDFPEVTRDQWRHLVEGVLRKTGTSDAVGAEAEEALATALEDGITVHPLYTADDAPEDAGFPGFAPFVRGGRAEGSAVSGWDVRQRHAHPDPAHTNQAILADLENGAGSVWLAVGAAGVPVDALPEALKGVYLDLATVALDAGADFEAAARALLRLYSGREVPPGAALGNLGADPLGLEARTGRDDGLAGQLAAAADLARICDRDHPGVRAFAVDAMPYHEAGAGAAQELGCSLAAAVAYLRTLTAEGLGVEAACAQLEFRYAATADQFLTIAKLRAARRLWARVAQACGAPSEARAQRQHAVTSPVMMTRRDPWVNMLRTTVATLAAGVGGADAVTVLPFDSAIGLPDDSARRIARNTSTILLEESHLARVIDPAGGSWYVEKLTDDVARAAWAWFQEIERAGGMAAALASGLVRDRLAETWARRGRALARRKEPITGVSEFPNLAERSVERDPAPERPGGGLPRVRRDEAYEALRTRSDAHLAAEGGRPRIFLAALGPAAAHTARASFASNLFQAGGIEAVHEPVTVTAETAAEAFTASGARVACLCSSDKLYAEEAAAVAERLKAAGATRVYLAGRPGAQQDEYERAGVDGYVFAGCDAVEVLSSALDTMGVA